MRRLRLLLSLVLCLLAAVSAVAAQEDAGAGKELRAYRITGNAPEIDGNIEDEVWLAAGSIDDFTQQEPDNMSAPRERTVVQVAYDDRFLYVAARCDVPEGSTVSAGLGRRGSIPASDKIAIALDPRHDHLTGYLFVVNPSGVQSDLSLFNDTREDSDYEAVWEVATSVTPRGWNAEFRIPFSQIRFSVADGERTVWGFQVRRDILETGGWNLWNAAPRGTQGFVSRFGHLVFGDRITPPRRIELMPFSLVRSVHDHEAGRSGGFDGGLDLRVGLGTSATLSATINPDFGQVELDPAVLNLSVFETFYPEKRPFFLEDSRIFVLPFGRFQMFHSRRIGGTPGRLEPEDDEELIDKPDQTTILGAAKITGKSSAWTYGGLMALTAREYAAVEIKSKNADGTEVVSEVRRLIEPRTMYGTGRVQRDILKGTSNVGGIATAVVREKDLDAFTGGGDYNIRWNRNLYTLNGQWVATHAPIDGVRRTDFGGETNLDFAGKHFGYTGHFDHFGKNFRNTDLGFMSNRVNKNWLYGGLRLSEPDPWKFSRNFDAFFYANRQWTDEGLVNFENINWWAGMRLKNYWHVSYGGDHNFEFLDDLDTRGGPPIVKPARNFYNVNINSDSRKRWGMGFFVFGNHDAADGWQRTLGTNLRLQPSGRLQANVSTNYSARKIQRSGLTTRTPTAMKKKTMCTAA
jgi:hypothetical protein